MTLQLVSVLRNQPTDKPEQLRGALEGLLGETLGLVTAKATASAIVDDAAFDCPDALAELNPHQLGIIGIPAGRHTRVCMALFGSDFGSAPNSAMATPVGASHPPGGPPPAYVVPAPVVNVTTAERVNRSIKAAWPAPQSTATPTPEVYLDFGLAIRTFLRKAPQISDHLGGPVHYTVEQWADVVFDRFSAPWTDLPTSHISAGPHDKMLCATLLEAPPGQIPPWASNLVRQQLSDDRGLEALMILGRQIFTTTDLSDRMAKDAVRTPRPATSNAHVSRRLAQWDSDWATVKARGFQVDDSDRRAGLLMLVSELKTYRPIIAAMEAAGTSDAAALRIALGKQADQFRSGVVAAKSAHAAGRVGAKPKNNGTIRDFQKAIQGYQRTASNPSQIPLCHAFRDTGTCRRGSACKYSHDPKAVDNRKDFLAACACFYDAGAGNTIRSVIWAVALQALRMGRTLDLRTTTSFFFDFLDSAAGDRLAACASAASPSTSTDTDAPSKSAFAHANP